MFHFCRPKSFFKIFLKICEEDGISVKQDDCSYVLEKYNCCYTILNLPVNETITKVNQDGIQNVKQEDINEDRLKNCVDVKGVFFYKEDEIPIPNIAKRQENFYTELQIKQFNLTNQVKSQFPGTIRDFLEKHTIDNNLAQLLIRIHEIEEQVFLINNFNIKHLDVKINKIFSKKKELFKRLSLFLASKNNNLTPDLLLLPENVFYFYDILKKEANERPYSTISFCKDPDLPFNLAESIKIFSKEMGPIQAYETRNFVKNLNSEARDLNTIMLEQYWSPAHIPYGNYGFEFNNLDKETKNIFLAVLAFFSQVDSIIVDLLGKVQQALPIHETKSMLSTQIGIEGVHAVVYGDLIDNLPIKYRNITLLCPPILKIYSFLNILNQDWVAVQLSVLGFGLVEGIIFSAAFNIICLLFRNNDKILHAMILANSLIMKDEATHVLTAFKNLSFFKYEHQPTIKITTLFVLYIRQLAINLIFHFYSKSTLGLPLKTLIDILDLQIDSQYSPHLGIQCIDISKVSPEARILYEQIKNTNTSEQIALPLEVIGTSYCLQNTTSKQNNTPNNCEDSCAL
jgi:ribonucleotide reductase beta subunit family protein with ferritin-like domain